VINPGFDQVVGQISAAAFGRHDASFAIETLDGVLVEHGRAL
jgi:hypothetical protein